MLRVNTAIFKLHPRMQMFRHGSRRRIGIAVGVKRKRGSDALHNEQNDAKQPDEDGFVILIQEIESSEDSVSSISALNLLSVGMNGYKKFVNGYLQFCQHIDFPRRGTKSWTVCAIDLSQMNWIGSKDSIRTAGLRK